MQMRVLRLLRADSDKWETAVQEFLTIIHNDGDLDGLIFRICLPGEENQHFTQGFTPQDINLIATPKNTPDETATAASFSHDDALLSEAPHPLLIRSDAGAAWTADYGAWHSENPAPDRRASLVETLCDRYAFRSLAVFPIELDHVRVGALTMGLRSQETFNLNRITFYETLTHLFTCLLTRIAYERREKALETQLRQAQKLEAIGILAGGIAHDFNNMLSIMVGYTELAMQKGADPEMLAMSHQQVLKAAERSKGLVRQILTFSRQAEQERKPLHLDLLVTESLKLLRPSIPSTIEIRHDIERGCGPILADPTQIHQVVMNLCVNAYHAMRGKPGVLEVKLRHCEISAAAAQAHKNLRTGPYVKLTVHDSGDGIPPETIAHIFEPFYSTKNEGEGAGMGLFIVDGIVANHGGGLTVFSQPGQGTTFEIYFPQIQEKKQEPTEASSPVPRGSGERILYVDDETQVLAVGASLLTSLGYDVTTMNSSVEALQLFRNAPYDYDLVLTDHTMPSMTGADLAKEMLALREDLIIILITGFSENLTPKEAAAIGIRKYLMKPVIMRDIALAINECLAEG